MDSVHRFPVQRKEGGGEEERKRETGRMKEREGGESGEFVHGAVTTLRPFYINTFLFANTNK